MFPLGVNTLKSVLKAIEFSIKDTIEIYDEEWICEIENSIKRGLDVLKEIKSIDEIIAVLAGVLINVSFLQIGYMPRRKGKSKSVGLRKGKWRLNAFRSVVYLQTNEQKECLFITKQRNELGFEMQQDLLGEYRTSGCDIPYSQWCKPRKIA